MQPKSKENHTKIRRTRPSYSCENCRLRRVKCDQARPKCGSCTKSSSACVYTASLKRKEIVNGSPRSENGGRIIRRKPESATQARLAYLSLQSGGRSRYIENDFWACVDIDGLDVDSLLSDSPRAPLGPVCRLGDETTDSGHVESCSRYFDTAEPNLSYWVSRVTSTCHSNTPNLANALLKLPSKPTCDVLYKVFRSAVHPLIPLVHIPTFDEQYRSFWDWYESWNEVDYPEGVLVETPSFLPLLLAVLFTASKACSALDLQTPLIPSHIRPLQNRLHEMSSDALTLVGFPHNPAIYSLMAYVLIHSVLIREEESLASCSFVAIALRVAQAMGIHKDGTNFGLDPIEVEERRRIWCQLLHLDVVTSMMSGLPLIASNESYGNTKAIGELRDECINRPKGSSESTAASSTPTLCPGYILAAGRYDGSSCIRSILIRQSAPQPITMTDVKVMRESIERLKERMDDRITKLFSLQTVGDELSAQSIQSTGMEPSLYREEAQPTLSTFKSWSEDLLKLMTEKAYCALYQPLVQDQLWSELRQEAVPHFQSFLRIIIRMCSTKSYQPFQWLYPGAYQPLQPAAVLLIDLLRSPNSETAKSSRMLLETIFSLLGPDGRVSSMKQSSLACVSRSTLGSRPLSNGALHSWQRLENLRRKVWNKLGLDSPELWAGSTAEKGLLARTIDNSMDAAYDMGFSGLQYEIGSSGGSEVGESNGLQSGDAGDLVGLPIDSNPNGQVYFSKGDGSLSSTFADYLASLPLNDPLVNWSQSTASYDALGNDGSGSEENSSGSENEWYGVQRAETGELPQYIGADCADWMNWSVSLES